MTTISEAALGYARRGLAVFPCWGIKGGHCACGLPDDASNHKPGKHPLSVLVPHGVKDATTDCEQVRRWWAAYPGANIGAAMGDLVAIDEDLPGSLLALGIQIPNCPAQNTGSGRHYFFKANGRRLRNRWKFAPGLDCRADGGYVIIAPSLHVSGKRYAWVAGHSLTDLEPPDIPGPLADLADSASGGDTDDERRTDQDLFGRLKVEVILSRLETMPQQRQEGGWRGLMLRLVASLVARGTPDEVILAICRRATWKDAGYTHADTDQWVSDCIRSTRRRWNIPESDEEEIFASPAGPTLVSAQLFVAGYKPPEYAVDGIIQRGRFYSLTAPTGHGKTAVSLRLGVHLSRGESLNGRTVEQGNVVYFAAENPDDAKARIVLMADKLSLELSLLPFHFIEGSFNLNDWLGRIRQEIERISGALCVIVDTGPAFQAACGFSEENDNMQALRFALMLRELTKLPGNPALLVPTHPIKNAGKDNLLPRGGSAFLNETDGNLTLWAEGERETTELHWAGKLRGPSFGPIVFALEKGTCPGLVDQKGRQVVSVWACLSDQRRAERAADRQREDEDAVLLAVWAAPDQTISRWAEHLGWLDANGEPLKSRVHRALERLQTERLATRTRNRWVLTKRGKEEAERLKGQAE